MTRGRTAEGRHAEHAHTERSKHLTHQTDVCLKDAQVVVGLEVSRVGLDGSLGVTDGCRRQSLHGIDQSQITHTLGAAPVCSRSFIRRESPWRSRLVGQGNC